MRVIDMHNHIVAPEVVAFLEREGERYDTRIVKREEKRFFLIQKSALRPFTTKLLNPRRGWQTWLPKASISKRSPVFRLSCIQKSLRR